MHQLVVYISIRLYYDADLYPLPVGRTDPASLLLPPRLEHISALCCRSRVAH
jgi:hypothetical protein